MTELACLLLATPSSHPVFVFTKKRPTEIKTAPSSPVGPCLHPWLASCPWSGGLTFGERSQLQQRATDSGPEEGGSDSEQGGWVRRHALNWHSTVPMSWMVSVSTIMVKMSHLLSVYSGMVKAVGSVALPWLCGPINIHGSPFYHLQWNATVIDF